MLLRRWKADHALDGGGGRLPVSRRRKVPSGAAVQIRSKRFAEAFGMLAVREGRIWFSRCPVVLSRAITFFVLYWNKRQE